QEIDEVVERNLGDGSTAAATADAVDPEPESPTVEADTGGAILDGDGDKTTDREAH
ncbi:MAG: hypothetical protein HYS64_07205, partial [Rhodospirillales bacterium]|nr:hypothetical protein [Rhodospirillales bacterium]